MGAYKFTPPLTHWPKSWNRHCIKSVIFSLNFLLNLFIFIHIQYLKHSNKKRKQLYEWSKPARNFIYPERYQNWTETLFFSRTITITGTKIFLFWFPEKLFQRWSGVFNVSVFKKKKLKLTETLVKFCCSGMFAYIIYIPIHFPHYYY